MPKGFQPGDPKPAKSGRKRGVSNKVTGDIRGMMVETLNDLGGKRYLAWLAIEHPQVFGRLLGQCLPKEIKISAQNTVEIVSEVREMREKRRLEIVKEAS